MARRDVSRISRKIDRQSSKTKHPVPRKLSLAPVASILLFAACSLLCWTAGSFFQVIGGYLCLGLGFALLYLARLASNVYEETIAAEDVSKLENDWWMARVLPNIPDYVESIGHPSLQGVKYPQHASHAREAFINAWEPDIDEFEKELDVAFGFVEGDPFDLKVPQGNPFLKVPQGNPFLKGRKPAPMTPGKDVPGSVYKIDVGWVWKDRNCSACSARINSKNPYHEEHCKTYKTKRDLCSKCGVPILSGSLCNICRKDHHSKVLAALKGNALAALKGNALDRTLAILEPGEIVHPLPSVAKRNADREVTINRLKRKQNRAKQLGDMKTSNRLNEEIHKLEVKQYEEDALLGIL